MEEITAYIMKYMGVDYNEAQKVARAFIDTLEDFITEYYAED